MGLWKGAGEGNNMPLVLVPYYIGREEEDQTLFILPNIWIRAADGVPVIWVKSNGFTEGIENRVVFHI